MSYVSSKSLVALEVNRERISCVDKSQLPIFVKRALLSTLLRLLQVIGVIDLHLMPVERLLKQDTNCGNFVSV